MSTLDTLPGGGRREAIFVNMPRVGLVLLLGLAVALPFTQEPYRVLQLAIAVTYAIAALGLNIVTGYSGQISLAQGAFFGIGAYSSAVLVEKHGWNYLATIPVAAVLAFVVGFLFGLPALRIRGLYLALVTVALSVSLRPFLEKFQGITGGKDGIIFDTPKAPHWTGLGDFTFLYFLALAVAVVLFIAARGMVRGRIGRAMVTLRDDETVGETMGISAWRVKTLAFAFAAMYAGIAGSLYALMSGAVTSDSFPLLLSVAFLAAIVIGGVATITGAIFGALFVEFMPYYASQINPGLSPVIYGVTLIGFMLLMPRGMVGLGSQALGRLRSMGRGRDPWNDESPRAEAGPEPPSVPHRPVTSTAGETEPPSPMAISAVTTGVPNGHLR